MIGRTALYFFLFLCLIVPAQAAEFSHALTMRGAPQLPNNFTHFSYVDPAAPKGGELRLAEVGTFDSVLPWLIKGNVPWEIDWMHDKLMARSWDEPFTLYPLIASGAKLSDDRRTLTFQIDPRARFQDGHPITAADVQFSYEFLLKNGRPNTRRIFAAVEKTEIENNQITFHFKKDSDPEAPMIVAMMTVLPKHYWEPMGARATQTSLAPPVASGPYKIKSLEAGRTIILERDPNYWAKDLPSRRGQYNFDTVRIDFYRDDAAALLAFKAGAYDFRREIDPRRWREQYDVPGLKRAEFANGAPAPLRAFAFNTRRELFSDLRVREALNLAFDFEWLNKNLFQNAYQRTQSIFPRSMLADDSYHAPQSNGDGYNRDNLRRAQSLLLDAGWQLRDGKLQNAAGRNFAFEILLNAPADEKIALAFQRSLKKLGITLTIRTLDAAQFAGRLEQFDFDMAVVQWASTLSPGSEQNVYWGSRAATLNGSRNYAGIADPDVDTEIAHLNQASDQADFMAAARALDRRIMAGQYFIPLYYAPRDWAAYWPGRVSPPENPSLYGTVLESWYAKP